MVSLTRVRVQRKKMLRLNHKLVELFRGNTVVKEYIGFRDEE